MAAVITYDVSMKQKEVKDAMKVLGYWDKWDDHGTIYNLPNTTLWKPEASVADALKDIQIVAKQLGVRLERAMAVPQSPNAGIPGEAHK